MSDSILKDVGNYYTGKIVEHGATPRGVDWNSVESQEVRFAQLLKIVNQATPFSLLDYGCGYGALIGYMLKQSLPEFQYCGLDISNEMLDAARRLYFKAANVEFIEQLSDSRKFDYVVASGIFNVRLGHADDTWKSYIHSEIERLANLASRGFAFNCLTSYSDVEYMRADLYYANPCELFDHCKRKYSRNVALLHDYNLYEFTIHVRF